MYNVHGSTFNPSLVSRPFSIREKKKNEIFNRTQKFYIENYLFVFFWNCFSIFILLGDADAWIEEICKFTDVLILKFQQHSSWGKQTPVNELNWDLRKIKFLRNILLFSWLQIKQKYKKIGFCFDSEMDWVLITAAPCKKTKALFSYNKFITVEYKFIHNLYIFRFIRYHINSCITIQTILHRSLVGCWSGNFLDCCRCFIR